MPSSDSVQRFNDIIENIERVERFTAGSDFQGFATNEQAVLAVKYALLIISEAATKLGAAADLCPDIPWREIRGLGNRLRHDYASIDVVRIWLLIETQPPPTQNCLSACAGRSERERHYPMTGHAHVSSSAQSRIIQLNVRRSTECEADFEVAGSGVGRDRKGLSLALRCSPLPFSLTV